ncbi:DUF4012 domain-containing protein [Ilumatobacter sp.]|uniref:DUF4012 domain-containing protein n=1 Tax=Ilumatobacter sp. TaxID=1967498 RepID=UPI0037504079
MNQRFIRRNRVDERLALSVACGSGLAATLGGARPTGLLVVDSLLVFVTAAAVVWASASASWWALASASGAAAVLAFEPLAAAFGALGFLAGLDVGLWRRDRTAVRVGVGGIAVNVLIRSEFEPFFGFSALVGLSICALVFLLGMLRRPSQVRRVGWLVAGAAAGVFAASLLCVGLAALSARSGLTNASRSARQGVAALNAGDYERAAKLFEQSAQNFESADGHLGGLLAAPGRLVPGVAQNVAAGRDLAAAAAEATAQAAGALRQVDPSKLRVAGGRIDLDEIRAVGAPLERVRVAFDGLRAVVEEVDSPWLVGPVQAELVEIDDEFASNEPRLDNAIEAVRLAPQMLGSERLRRYLILFTTPAEARGLGGFVGSFVVLEIDEGALSVTDFGRTSELSRLTSGADCSACDPELLQRYGRFGFSSGEDGTTGTVLFSNVTMPAHFPYIAAAVQAIYPQGRGEQIDGVLVMDPYVVQALMQYSGPIEVPALDTVVQPNNAAEFLLRDQYILGENKGARVEALDALGKGAIEAVLSGVLPEPPELARDFGPLVSERRLLMWTDNPDEQLLLDRVGMLGSIPTLDERDGGFSVSVTNGSANKIDVFLDRTSSVELVEDEAGRRLVADVTLTNNAPAVGLPRYVIGNAFGAPDGSSRLFVSFYGVPELMEITSNGEPFGVEALPEAGWMAFSSFITLQSGETRTFQLTFQLPERALGDTTPSSPTLWTQPLADR